MKALLVVCVLALATLAVPAASAGHTIRGCMSVWLDPPPGWDDVCATTDWVVHNPASPLAACLLAPLEIYVIGVSYDPFAALACI